LAAWLLYFFSVASGLTWAHQGADGAELLAAAVVNGVPHPPGYPLYMMLLQLWLTLLGALLPASDLAWRGNLFSAFSAGLSAGLVTLTAHQLLIQRPGRWLWAALAGLAWASSPLLWSQAVITEVYALHAFIIALLGWVVLVRSQRLWRLALPVALGVAHHLTLVLLAPAVVYLLWVQERTWARFWRILLWLAVGGALGMLLYLRIPWVASSAPPINWGYADNWRGFWWLVSGEAYRGYLFAGSLAATLGRLSAWAYTLTVQLTPFGLTLALIGLARWDRDAPTLRNFALFWLTPISIYAVIYYTRDSDIYLLPVTWLLSILFAVGVQVSFEWLVAALADRGWARWVSPGMVVALLLVGLAAAAAIRWRDVALTGDVEAQRYLAHVAAAVEPDAIVISRADRETFALWYGAWASGELMAAAPGIIPLNDSLYQFDWYRRLQGALYPGVPGITESVERVIADNRGRRTIFFAEELPIVESDRLTPAPPLWRYTTE
jgi:hypothetical protein